MRKTLGWFVFFSLVVFWALYAFMPPAWAGEVAVLKGEAAITFGPISEKVGQLVEVELVSSVKHQARYKRLELAIFRNDWRPLLFASGRQSSPGKCTIVVLSDSYAVSCLMIYRDKKPDTLEIRVPDPDSVVAVATYFSRKLEE